MREILFRGKKIDGGEWVEGSLRIDHAVHDEGSRRRDDFYNIVDITTSFVESYRYLSGVDEPVDPATVGQYIGMRDTNGKRIFEGDKISVKVMHTNFACDPPEPPEVYYEIATVIWSGERLGWCAKFGDEEIIFMWEYNDPNDVEVIGNIYEEENK